MMIKLKNLLIESGTSDFTSFKTKLAFKLGIGLTSEKSKFFDAWKRLENTKATNNPFATTLNYSKDPDMTKFNNANRGQGVKNFSTIDYGVDATAITMNLGYYKSLIAKLNNDDITAVQLASDKSLDKWGSGSDKILSVLGSKRQSSGTIAFGSPSTTIITKIQEKLISLGYNLNPENKFKNNGADGIFGSVTKSVVEQYQSKELIKSDGIVGPDTWSKLFPSEDYPIVIDKDDAEKDDAEKDAEDKDNNGRGGSGKGSVWGKLEPKSNISLNPALLDDIRYVSDKLGIKIKVTSGVRPGDKTKKGTYSNHAFGNALDLGKFNDSSYSNNKAEFKRLGDKIIDSLKSLGYKEWESKSRDKAYIWQSSGHYNHIHMSNKSGTTSYDLTNNNRSINEILKSGGIRSLEERITVLKTLKAYNDIVLKAYDDIDDFFYIDPTKHFSQFKSWNPLTGGDKEAAASEYAINHINNVLKWSNVDLKDGKKEWSLEMIHKKYDEFLNLKIHGNDSGLKDWAKLNKKGTANWTPFNWISTQLKENIDQIWSSAQSVINQLIAKDETGRSTPLMKLIRIDKNNVSRSAHATNRRREFNFKWNYF